MSNLKSLPRSTTFTPLSDNSWPMTAEAPCGNARKARSISPAAGRVVGPEGTIAVRQLRMHLAQNSPGVGVGTEIDQVEAVVAIDELDQLTTGIPGSAENRRANAHEATSIRICGWSERS